MKILILSHTRKLSDFKIGSHHYANNLSREHNVVFIGTPLSIVHKLFGKKEKGVSQLSDNVDYRQVTTLLPLPKTRMFKLKKKNYILDKATKK